MIVKDLERLLASNGMGRAKMDVITRQLREFGHLPVAPRGYVAPKVTGISAAKVLIAAAGSAKGVAADRRLQLLAKLKSAANDSETLLSRLAQLLDGDVRLQKVAECRVGRNIREATLIFDDETTERFSTTSPPDYTSRLRVEGVIPGKLLRTVASLIANDLPLPAATLDDEPDFDS